MGYARGKHARTWATGLTTWVRKLAHTAEGPPIHRTLLHVPPQTPAIYKVSSSTSSSFFSSFSKTLLEIPHSTSPHFFFLLLLFFFPLCPPPPPHQHHSNHSNHNFSTQHRWDTTSRLVAQHGQWVYNTHHEHQQQQQQQQTTTRSLVSWAMDLQVLLAMGAKEKKKKPHHKFTTPLKWWWCTHIYLHIYISIPSPSHVVEHMKEIFFHQH